MAFAGIYFVGGGFWHLVDAVFQKRGILHYFGQSRTAQRDIVQKAALHSRGKYTMGNAAEAAVFAASRTYRSTHGFGDCCYIC